MRRITMALLLCAALLIATVAPVFAASQSQSPPRVAAPSAILLDFETGEVLFERGADILRAPASMTKAMTAFVIYEEIEAGRLSLNTRIRVSNNAARVSNDANLQGNRLPLRAGSYITVDTMLHLIMLPSSNGACVAMAEHISGSEAAFARRMNESAQAIGMTSYFTNAHGALPHYTTARSMGILLREFISQYPDILRVTSAQHIRFDGSNRANTNLLIRPGEFHFRYADGFRTGTTREAGFCLASTAYRDGRRVISVVMGTRNNQERYGDSRALLEFGLQESARMYAERAEQQRLEQEEAERRREERRRERARISIVVGDDIIEFDESPRMIDGRAMAPIELFTALGAELSREGDIFTLVTDTGDIILITIGRHTVRTNGRVSRLDSPPLVEGDVVFLPVGFMVEAAGGRIARWDGETRTVTISYLEE